MHVSLKNALALTALAALGPTAARPVAAQDLNGQDVHLQYFFPDLGTLHEDDGTQPVTPAGAAFTSLGGQILNTLVKPSQIVVTFNVGTAFALVPFNGIEVSEVGGSPVNITSVTVDPATTIAGFDASRITFDAHNIFANFQSLPFTTSDNITLDVNSAPVPEASTTVSLGLLLALGLGGGIIAGRRKKQSA